MSVAPPETARGSGLIVTQLIDERTPKRHASLAWRLVDDVDVAFLSVARVRDGGGEGTRLLFQYGDRGDGALVDLNENRLAGVRYYTDFIPHRALTS